MSRSGEEGGRPEKSWSDAAFETLFLHSHDAVGVLTDSGTILEVNPAMARLLGAPRDALSGTRVSELFSDSQGFLQLRDRLLGSDSGDDYHLRLLEAEGREVLCRVTVAELPGLEGREARFLLIADDATDRVHVEERFHHAALHDSLTQLPNRTFFLDRLQRLLDRWKHAPENPFAVLFIDLDRFKLINDSLGHRAGDELLIMVAERLLDLVRPGDIVARFGGDEFTVLLPDLPGLDAATHAADRIRHRLQDEAFRVLGHDVYVTASTGIAMGNRDYASGDEIIRDADTAMYAAKDEGRGRWKVFDDAMRERAVLRFTTESALQRGLEREQFVLHYQPVVTIDGEEILGFEALVRWDHPERGLLPPADFLSLAEDTGLIIPLGRWVLREACRVAAEWRESVPIPCEAPFMAVNLSARQLMDPALGTEVRAVLEETGLPGDALRIEITETVFLTHSDVVRETLVELAELGIFLCLDDFGCGYSSLSYLNHLPVRLIKIDRSFVSGLSGDRESSESQVTGALLSLAARLGMETVAEGVESEAERDCLIGLGCRNAQGFLYSRPLMQEDALSLLLNGM